MGQLSTDVLIVDDDPLQFAGLKRLLARRSVVAHYAATPEAALAVLASTAVHAAIVDLHLGPASGAALIRAIRERFPLVRTVLASGSSPEEVEPIAVACGAAAWLDKPFSVEDLMSAIELIG